MVDCLIRGGTIVDGSGGALFAADLAITAGRLQVLERGASPIAERIIHCEGMMVAPGFIDVHSHNDLVAVTQAEICDKVSQGVTTEIIGNCGFSAFPSTSENEELAENLMSLITPEKLSEQHRRAWRNWQEFSSALRNEGCQANVVGQVGHMMLRSAVMGMSMRRPAPVQLATMQRLLAESFEQGASGLSFGLMYNPSSYAERNEITELCRTAALHGKFVSVHLRGYDAESLLTSMAELIDAAEETRARLQLSHLSPTGRDAQGLTDQMLDAVDEAIARGVDVALDRYPYEHGMSRLELIFPKWVVSDSPAMMIERLSNRSDLERMYPEIDKFVGSIGYENIKLNRNCDSAFIGKSLHEVSVLLDVAPAAAAAKVMRDSRGFAGIILTLSTMETQERVIQHCRCMIGSDGMPSLRATHPRTFGTFPRVIGPFVSRGVLTLQEAVFKMTGLPAERFGLVERGRIANGFIADVAIFDPNFVTDRSTFESPYQVADGIKEVLVAGETVYRNGEILPARPGRVLTCRIPTGAVAAD